METLRSAKDEAAFLWEGLSFWLDDKPLDNREFFRAWDLNGWEVVRGHKQHHVLTVGHGHEMGERASEIAAELTRLATVRTA